MVPFCLRSMLNELVGDLTLSGGRVPRPLAPGQWWMGTAVSSLNVQLGGLNRDK